MLKVSRHLAAPGRHLAKPPLKRQPDRAIHVCLSTGFQPQTSGLPAYRLFSLEIAQNNHRVVHRVVASADLPPHWQENTYTRSQHILADWLAKPDVLALGVPPSVMPDGINYSLHPAPSSYALIRGVGEKPLVIDPRLWFK